MKNLIILIIGVFSSMGMYAQTLKIIDKTNLQPIAKVSIESDNVTKTETNDKGKADISAFKNADQIWLIHPDYGVKIFSYSELAAMNFLISLTENSYLLDEVIISANRFQESLKDVAQPVQVLNSKKIAFLNQQTSADVLQSSGNVFIQKSQMGGGSPVIRGFETNKVLIVVDGVRMNNAIYRGGHLQNVITLDNSMLDRLEVVFGPGSVVYGSDALGGVMHFYSKNPSLSYIDSLRVKANAFSRYATANSEKTGHVDVSLGNRKWGSLTSFTYSDFGDLRQGAFRNELYDDYGKRTFYVERQNNTDVIIENDKPNVQRQSGYKQYDVLQKFLYRQSDYVSHTLNFQYSTSSDIPRYDRLTQVSNGLPRFAQWYYGPQQRLFGSYSLDIKSDNGFFENARFILGYQNIEESRNDRKFNSANLNHRTETLDIFTFNADFEKRFGKNEIRYGVDAWLNDVKSNANVEDITTGERSPLDTRYPDGGSKMKSLSAYITHSYEINEQWVLNDGIRISNVTLEAKFDDKTFFPFPFDEVKQNNTALNGNIGIIYMPGDDWRLTAIGSSGFRAPNVDDLSKVFESAPGEVVVPNPDLKPEYTYNAELGVSKSIEKMLHMGVTGYYTWYRDAITTARGTYNGESTIIYDGEESAILTNVNTNKAYIYGINGYLNADITPEFSITNTINYTFGRIKQEPVDYPLDHISPLYGRTSFNVNLNKFKGSFFVAYNGPKKSKDYNLLGEDNEAYSLDPINGYTPGWFTLNLSTAYQFNSYLQLQLQLDNILDQNYRPFASNISAPGRNFLVTLRASL
jgi:hemoglobin/transferrin/lactoferrin receptor protein